MGFTTKESFFFGSTAGFLVNVPSETLSCLSTSQGGFLLPSLHACLWSSAFCSAPHSWPPTELAFSLPFLIGDNVAVILTTFFLAH